jgi:hypothetical protein
MYLNIYQLVHSGISGGVEDRGMPATGKGTSYDVTKSGLIYLERCHDLASYGGACACLYSLGIRLRIQHSCIPNESALICDTS